MDQGVCLFTEPKRKKPPPSEPFVAERPQIFQPVYTLPPTMPEILYRILASLSWQGRGFIPAGLALERDHLAMK
jgi:hypothetical protein